MERLQKVIANAGYTSRRKAEELIAKGRVKVNGQIVREMGTKVESTDAIEVDGLGLDLNKDEKVYILLNKPRGVVTTTSDDKKRKTVVDLIETDIRIYPVGRLDYDTTGALLLTNDGDLTNYLLHPSNDIEKEYIAKVVGKLNGELISKLTNGVIIDGKKTAKARIKIKKYDLKTNVSLVQITIHEGKNHQIKKMFEAIDMEVLKLKRERIAFLDVKGLNSGDYRYLSLKEVKCLYNQVSNE